MGVLSFGRHGKLAESAAVLRCSFCHKTQDTVGKLISSPQDYGPIYICNECIEVCNSVLEGERAERTSGRAQAMGLPDALEFAPHFGPYISLVGGSDVVAALEEQPRYTLALLSDLSEEQADYRYAPGKWSIKEVLGHLIDTERVMAYQALHFAREDRSPLGGFEADDYVRAGGFRDCSLTYLMEEFAAVRDATVFQFEEFSPAVWMRRGIAGGTEVSVRAIAYIIAGHELHHRRVLREKYRPTSVR